MAAKLVFADSQGQIFNHPYLQLVGRSGWEFSRLSDQELMPLPPGSDLFVLPGWRAGRFWVAGWRRDPDVRQDLSRFDCNRMAQGVKDRLAANPGNRLLQHLSHCALGYGCPAVRDVT